MSGVEDPERMAEKAVMVDWAEIPEEIREKMGAWRTLSGQCPMGSTNPMACMFCSYGHMTECHHPLTCEEAECSHWRMAYGEG